MPFGIVKHRLVEARLHAVRKLVPDIGHARHRAERQRRDIGPGHGELARPIGNVRFVHFEHARGNLLGLGDDAGGGDMDARSAHRHRAGVEGAVAGLHLSRVALHDVDVFDRNLQHVGGDLRQRRDVAVALAHRARKDRRPGRWKSTLTRALSQPPRSKPISASRRDGAMPHMWV